MPFLNEEMSQYVNHKINKNVPTYSKVRSQPKVNATGANNVQNVEVLDSSKYFLERPNLSKISKQNAIIAMEES